MRIRDYLTYQVGTGKTGDRHLLIWLLLGFAFFLPISISFAQPFAYLAVAVWGYGMFRRKDYAFASSPLFWPVVLYAGITLLAVFLGPSPLDTLIKSRRLLLLCLMFAIGSAFRTDHDDLRCNTFVLMGLFVLGTSVLGIWDVVRVPVEVVWLDRDWYDTGNMRDPQLYLVGLCFLLAMWRTGAQRTWSKWMSAALTLNMLGVLLHFKRGVWISLFLAAFMVASFSKQRRIIVLLAVFGAALMALPQTRERMELLREEFLVQTGGRYVLWLHVAPQMLRDHPLGVGPRGLTHEDFRSYSRHIQPGLNHLHNNMLQVAVDSGWAGLMIWMWWMIVTGVVMGRLYVRLRGMLPGSAALALGCFGAFIGLMLNGLVEYNFGNSVIYMTMVLLMGMALSIQHSGQPKEGEPIS